MLSDWIIVQFTIFSDKPKLQDCLSDCHSNEDITCHIYDNVSSFVIKLSYKYLGIDINVITLNTSNDSPIFSGHHLQTGSLKECKQNEKRYFLNYDYKDTPHYLHKTKL